MTLNSNCYHTIWFIWCRGVTQVFVHALYQLSIASALNKCFLIYVYSVCVYVCVLLSMLTHSHTLAHTHQF